MTGAPGHDRRAPQPDEKPMPNQNFAMRRTLRNRNQSLWYSTRAYMDEGRDMLECPTSKELETQVLRREWQEEKREKGL